MNPITLFSSKIYLCFFKSKAISWQFVKLSHLLLCKLMSVDMCFVFLNLICSVVFVMILVHVQHKINIFCFKKKAKQKKDNFTHI